MLCHCCDHSVGLLTSKALRVKTKWQTDGKFEGGCLCLLSFSLALSRGKDEEKVKEGKGTEGAKKTFRGLRGKRKSVRKLILIYYNELIKWKNRV